MRYFFHIGYYGTQYRGWQKHPGAPNVQEVIEKALSQVLKTPLWIVGCGRTDAQVHASQYFFHTDTDATWNYDLIFRLNKLLPQDIAVFEIIPMQASAHARFDATQRSYDYLMHSYKDPFLANFSSVYPVQNWDIPAMNRAAQLLLNYTDYRAFCKSPDQNDHTICHVSAAGIFTDKAGEKLRFHISANRFLGKMVRIILGKLIDVGSGKLSMDEFEHHLIYPQLAQIIKPAYPQGLYLSKIVYPYLNTAPRSSFTQMLAGTDTTWQGV